MEKNYKCKLFPYTKQDCVSIQEVKQKAGWSITAFDLPKAWEYSQGDGVIIAVLDTGCQMEHEDLKDNLLEGMNIIKPGEPPIDKVGHGTHCCGILVAENNDIGVVGVCPKAKVIPVKVLDDRGNGTLQNVAEGVRWATDRGVDIITMSLGAKCKLQQVRKAIQYAESKNVSVFVAAGNVGNTSEIFYPANYPETIAIGAIDENFERATFSNTGYELDFMAPGVNILSTVPDNWYSVYSGTSMSCPFAAGIAALLLSHVKSGKAKITINSVDDLRNTLKKYTTPVNNINLKDSQFYQGFGIIDARKFMEN